MKTLIAFLLLVGVALGQHIKASQADIGTLNVSGNSTVKTVNVNTLYADQFAGSDACAKIMAAHAVLAAATGGIIDATGFVGSQTCAAGLTLGTLNGPIVLRLPGTFLTIPSSPCVSVAAGTSVSLVGLGGQLTSASDPTISCTNSTGGAVGIKWLGSRGGIEKVQVIVPATMEGLLLDANAAGQDVKFNTFKDFTLNSAPSNTNDGVQLNALDSTHKVSFNNFINVEIVDFQQAYDLTMQSGGSFGPTDNAFFGGQGRRTTAAAGTGINVGQAAQNNWFYGGNYSFYTTGINLGAFATTIQNNFFGVTVESIGTTPCKVGAAAADNHFYGVTCSTGGLNSTDSGNSTLFDNVNFSGLNVSKIGRPLLALPVIEAGAPSAASGLEACYGDSTAHALKCSYNNGSFLIIPQTLNVTSGTSQTARAVAGCTTGSSAGNSCGTDITVTWGTAFPDANYSVTCTGNNPTNVPSGPFIVSASKLAATVHVNYFAITAAAASYASIDCIAIHD